VNGIEFLLDTNMVIGLLKGQPQAVELAEQVGFNLQKAAVSQITRMELLGYPKLTVDEAANICAFLALCKIYLLDELIEAETIRLRQSGAFKLPDAIIAATAVTKQLQLLTLDQSMKHSLQTLGYGC
jgi:predicted nucleic acid-binding protein